MFKGTTTINVFIRERVTDTETERQRERHIERMVSGKVRERLIYV